jgi:formylmethanofuran dehydrogenase subunit E
MVRILSENESKILRDKKAYVFRCANCDDFVAAKRDTVAYATGLCTECLTIQGG